MWLSAGPALGGELQRDAEDAEQLQGCCAQHLSALFAFILLMNL